MIDKDKPVYIYLVAGSILKEIENKEFENLDDLNFYLSQENHYQVKEATFFENAVILKISIPESVESSSLVIKNTPNKKKYFLS